MWLFLYFVVDRLCECFAVAGLPFNTNIVIQSFCFASAALNSLIKYSCI